MKAAAPSGQTPREGEIHHAAQYQHPENSRPSLDQSRVQAASLGRLKLTQVGLQLAL